MGPGCGGCGRYAHRPPELTIMGTPGPRPETENHPDMGGPRDSPFSLPDKAFSSSAFSAFVYGCASLAKANSLAPYHSGVFSFPGTILYSPARTIVRPDNRPGFLYTLNLHLLAIPLNIMTQPQGHDSGQPDLREISAEIKV